MGASGAGVYRWKSARFAIPGIDWLPMGLGRGCSIRTPAVASEPRSLLKSAQVLPILFG